jgi:hypothetical protein
MPVRHSLKTPYAKVITKFQNTSSYEQIYLFSETKQPLQAPDWRGGFIVGICALSPWNALYSAAVAASCLELKDVLHGCRWDCFDWLITVAGGGTAALIWLFI